MSEAIQGLDQERCFALRQINKLLDRVPTFNLQQMVKHLGDQLDEYEKRQAEPAKPQRRSRKKPVIVNPPA